VQVEMVVMLAMGVMGVHQAQEVLGATRVQLQMRATAEFCMRADLSDTTSLQVSFQTRGLRAVSLHSVVLVVQREHAGLREQAEMAEHSLVVTAERVLWEVLAELVGQVLPADSSVRTLRQDHLATAMRRPLSR
jgi:hypothetical protein